MGIKAMIVGMIFSSFIAYFINSYYSSKLIDYSVSEQFKDILPNFVISLFVAIIVFIMQIFIPISAFFKLIISIPIGFGIAIIFSNLFNIDGYTEIKNIIKELIWKKRVQTPEHS